MTILKEIEKLSPAPVEYKKTVYVKGREVGGSFWVGEKSNIGIEIATKYLEIYLDYPIYKGVTPKIRKLKSYKYLQRKRLQLS